MKNCKFLLNRLKTCLLICGILRDAFITVAVRQGCLKGFGERPTKMSKLGYVNKLVQIDNFFFNKSFMSTAELI